MSSDPDFPEFEESTLPTLQIQNPSGFNLPVDPEILNEIFLYIEQAEQINFVIIELVYVNEDEIIRINKKYLDRDYVTDIISFRYDEQTDNQAIEGTLFCCAPRIAEQSSEFGTAHEEEFYRIFIHGLLHLAGYDDDTSDSKKQMTDLENRYLNEIL